jgi:hypothetical protein
MSFPHLGGVLKLGFTSSFVPISGNQKVFCWIECIKMGFVHPMIERYTLGPLGNQYHTPFANKWLMSLITWWYWIAERVKSTCRKRDWIWRCRRSNLGQVKYCETKEFVYGINWILTSWFTDNDLCWICGSQYGFLDPAIDYWWWSCPHILEPIGSHT